MGAPDANDEPAFPAECSGAIDVLNDCIPSCSGGGSSSGCSMSCSGGKLPPWGAECTVSGSELACTCTSGAGTGKTFTATGTCAEPDTLQAQMKAECS